MHLLISYVYPKTIQVQLYIWNMKQKFQSMKKKETMLFQWEKMV